MDTNEQDVDLNNEADELDDVEEIPEEKEEAKPKDKPKRTPEEQLAYLEGRTQRLRKKLGLVEARKKPEAKESDELSDAQYAYLAAKGIEDEDDVDFIHTQMKKWDKTLREVLKDEDVQTKLKGIRIERDVKKAMPASTKRAGSGGTDNLDYWTAKYDQTGELPDDFDLRTAVIDAKVAKSSPNRPPWRR